jgi:ABC-type multidrug transport system ATPase subunit
LPEGLVHLVSQFTRVSAFAVVVAQSCLIVLCAFTLGSLIQEREVPSYWVWLQEISLFNHAGRAVAVAVADQVDFECRAVVDTGAATCSLPTLPFVWPCSAAFDAVSGLCSVTGTDTLRIYKDLAVTDKWLSFLYLLILAVAARLGVLFMYYFPIDVMTSRIRAMFASDLSPLVLETHVLAQRMGGEVDQLKSELALSAPNHKAAVKIQQRWRRYRIRQRFVIAVYQVMSDNKIGDQATVAAAAAAALGRSGINKRRSSRKHSKESFSFETGTLLESLLAWRNLTLTLPKGKVLIDHVDGFARGGHVLALMGPSGAGKTTMLNALSARATYARVAGAVEFNGRPLSRDDLSFVPQFDDLNESFTVMEILMYTGRLRSKLTARELHKHLLTLINILGLKEQSHERTSSLTSGQRKRVSIGVGLVGQPNVLFLDEPTTGLDSVAAFSIVDYISRVVKATNVVCVMTIHQPSGAVFNSLDDLYLLERGHLAFFGKVSTASDYFDSFGFHCRSGCNPADYYLDLISKPPIDARSSDGGQSVMQMQAASTWKDLYLASPFKMAGNTMSMPQRPAPEPVAESTRLRILLEREYLFSRRNPVYYLRTLQLLLISLFLGTLYIRLDQSVSLLTELSGASFLSIWVVLFSVTASAPTFARVRRQVQQEYVNGSYKLWTYCVAQFLASIPATLLASLLYQSVLHWLVGFNDTFEAFVYAILGTFSLLMLMEAITLGVVEGLKDAMLSVTFSMILMGMLFLFAGYFVLVENIPPSVRWLTWLIPSRYALEGSLDNVFSGQDYELPGSGSVTGDNLLSSVFGHDDSSLNKWVNWLIVILWMLLYRVVHWGILLFTNRHFGKSKAASTGSSTPGAAAPPSAVVTTSARVADE